MTKEQLAALLNGREYRKEITKIEAAQAKAAGLLVIYGASDDLLEFYGAFRDELGAYGGCDALVYPEGVLPAWENFDEKEDEAEADAYFSNKCRSVPVGADFDRDGYTWVIDTTIPHATFEIMDDGEKFCRGIVIEVQDIADAAQALTPEKGELLEFANEIMERHDYKVSNLRAIAALTGPTTLKLDGTDGSIDLTEREASFFRIGIEVALLELGTLPFSINGTSTSTSTNDAEDQAFSVTKLIAK